MQNREYGLSIQLVTDNTDALPGIISRTMTKGVRNFESGVAAALLAPTAMNKQAFTIKGQDHSVTMTYEKGSFSGADLGICKYHFELGVGMENFIWK